MRREGVVGCLGLMEEVRGGHGACHILICPIFQGKHSAPPTLSGGEQDGAERG